MLAFMLNPKLPYFDDPEGAFLPETECPVIDAHVHVFPKPIFKSIWQWFDTHAWKIRYRMTTEKIFQFLLDRGISRIAALQYAHKPGIALMLNQYLAERIAPFKGKVLGMATLFPGEDGEEDILRQAFSLGLDGVKLHAHVQCFDMNAPYMDIIYQTCADHEKPLIMHVGQEPSSPAYQCDPYQLCNARKLENVIKNFPALKVCVPHLGFGELASYQNLLERYDNLWTDTTMVITDYFPIKKIDLAKYRADRVMYGSDFPNIPYAWDRELKELVRRKLPDDILPKILHQNAEFFFNIKKF